MNISVKNRPKTATPDFADGSFSAPPDRSRLNVRNPRELKYWCEVLGVQPARLKRAVLLAGVMLTDVKMYLRRQALPEG